MNWIRKNIRIGNMGTHSRTGLVLAGCLTVLISIGCAQHKAYEAPPAKPVSPIATGLVVSGKFRSVVIEDMDNDGNLDIIGGASSPGMVTISYGDGKGAVSEAQILPVHGEVRSVAVADFNEDGLNDIIFSAQKETSGIRLWMNQSNRKWKQENGPVKINKYQNLKAADVNSDGHMDVIAANSTEDVKAGVQVWLGNGKGGWNVESGPTTMGRYMDVALADLNKDGFLDLIGAGWGTYGSVRIWLGDGTGKWSSTSPLKKGSYYGVSVGDLNGDGNLDVFAASYQSGFHVFEGDGNGNFSKIRRPREYVKKNGDPNSGGFEVVPIDESFWEAIPIDLNGDGIMDVVASSLDSKGIMAWIKEENHKWKKIEDLFPSTGVYFGMAVADLNADGYQDLCAASYGEGIQIWPGNSGKAIKARNMEIEQLPSEDRLAVFEAPIENEVFTTINGVVEYKIGPGDVLEITYWEGSTSTKEEILVRPGGKISFSFVEDVPAKGLTASQLDDLLTKNLSRYVRKPRIDVIITEFNSKSVTLLGAIAYRDAKGSGPGEYRLSGKTTLLELITKAGGAIESANLQRVNIRRKNGQSISLNLFEAIHQGDPGTDFVLNDGDVIFIPTLAKDGNRIFVFGEVEQPGTYTFKDSDIRLADVIAEAGGPTVFATESSTKIVRGDITRPEIISADLEDLLENGDQSQNVVLVAGDIVYVPRSWIGDVNRFALQMQPIFNLLMGPGRVWNSYN
jgi:protein involved in polysaccharide export with SLBB domain/outer membrane lipoprotein SlyB